MALLVQVDNDDLESVVIKFDAAGSVGVAFDELQDEYAERGLRMGCATRFELSLDRRQAAELLVGLAKAMVLAHLAPPA